MVDVGEMVVSMGRLARAVRRARDVDHWFVIVNYRIRMSLERTQPIRTLSR